MRRCIKNKSVQGKRVVGCGRFDYQNHCLRRGLQHRVLVHHRHRRLLASAQAGCGNHPHPGTQYLWQPSHQFTRTDQLAAQAIAHAHRQSGDGRIVAQHLEVVVEGGYLVDLGQRQVHQLGQCRQVPLMQAAVLVVEPVQLLDQQVSPVRRRAHQCPHLQHRRLIGLAPLKPAYFADALAHVVQRGEGLGRAVGCQHIRSHGI